MEYLPNAMLSTNVPRIHCFVYADPGRMKSTFASTFPKPMLVLATDPVDKMTPYRRRGILGDRVQPNEEAGIWVPTEYIMSTKDEDKVATQIEYYIDRTAFAPEEVTAWEQIQDRMQDLWVETNNNKWATVVLDSLSSLEFAIRSHYQHKENPVTKDGNEQDQRQWYRKSAEGLEQVTNTMAWLNCNVVVLAHVRAEKDAVRDTILWTPEAPGTRNRRIPSVFGEIYTIHVDPEPPEGVSPFYLQTEADGRYVAATQIPAPPDCDPTYSALWTDYKPLRRKEATNNG